MSGIYYVYMKWTSENSIQRADYGRQLLTFPSRWDADELFRGLQTLKTTTGTIWFSTLQRVNPQFWCYDMTIEGGLNSPESWWIFVQNENVLPEFNYNFMATLCGPRAGAHSPVFANPTIGPDWVSGKTFYIRNRRQPNLYWCYDNCLIVISTSRRSKFLIKDNRYDGERVLIRKDEVTIRPVFNLGTPIGDWHVLKNGDGEVLSVGSRRQVWNFSDLFDSVGVTWNSKSGFPSGTQFATSLPGLGDEWELC